MTDPSVRARLQSLLKYLLPNIVFSIQNSLTSLPVTDEVSVRIRLLLIPALKVEELSSCLVGTI